MKKKNISEELVVQHCSPTMAGLKTGNLFNCPTEDAAALMEDVRALNRRLVPKGVRVLPLKVTD